MLIPLRRPHPTNVFEEDAPRKRRAVAVDLHRYGKHVRAFWRAFRTLEGARKDEDLGEVRGVKRKFGVEREECLMRKRRKVDTGGVEGREAPKWEVDVEGRGGKRSGISLPET